MLEFNKKNQYRFSNAGIICVIRRVLDGDVEQFYVTDNLIGLSPFEVCTVEPLYNEGMCKNGLYNLVDNLNRFAETKLRINTPQHKSDTQWQPQQYLC